MGGTSFLPIDKNVLVWLPIHFCSKYKVWYKFYVIGIAAIQFLKEMQLSGVMEKKYEGGGCDETFKIKKKVKKFRFI